MRMLVTRPEPDAAETVARLAALGIPALAVPLLERVTLETSLPEPRGFAALALTSANALRALEERKAIAPFRDLEVFAVGDRTAEAARRLGFNRVVSAGGSFADLIQQIGSRGLAGPVFHPAARQQSHDLARALAPFGLMTITTEIYEMHARTALPDAVLAELADGGIGAALFYSRRTAETFAALARPLDAAARRRLGLLCLAEAVAAPLLADRFARIAVAEHPSEKAMLALALTFARGQNTA
jgi:uroporphyrinogen-III synthase